MGFPCLFVLLRRSRLVVGASIRGSAAKPRFQRWPPILFLEARGFGLLVLVRLLAGFRAEPKTPPAMDDEAEWASTVTAALHDTCLVRRMEFLRRLDARVAKVFTKRLNKI